MVNISDYNCRSSSGTAACCFMMIRVNYAHIYTDTSEQTEVMDNEMKQFDDQSVSHLISTSTATFQGARGDIFTNKQELKVFAERL